MRGQDPKDHFWLWFKTIRGEEVTLDMSMFPFNFGIVVDLKGHIPSRDLAMYEFAPAFFEEREIRKEARKAPVVTRLHKERSRVSVLHSTELAETISHSHEHTKVYPQDIQHFQKFMSRASGRNIPVNEARDAHRLAHTFLHGPLEENLRNKLWAKAPSQPIVGFNNA